MGDRHTTFSFYETFGEASVSIESRLNIKRDLANSRKGLVSFQVFWRPTRPRFLGVG